jgi:hypothetical protein
MHRSIFLLVIQVFHGTYSLGESNFPKRCQYIPRANSTCSNENATTTADTLISNISSEGIEVWTDCLYGSPYTSPYTVNRTEEFNRGHDLPNLQSAYSLSPTDTERVTAINARIGSMIDKFSVQKALRHNDTSYHPCTLTFQDFDIPYNGSWAQFNYTLLTDTLNIYNPLCPFGNFTHIGIGNWGNFNWSTPIVLTRSFHCRTRTELKSYGRFVTLQNSLVNVPVVTPIEAYAIPALYKLMCDQLSKREKKVLITGVWFEPFTDIAMECGFMKAETAVLITAKDIRGSMEYIQEAIDLAYDYYDDDMIAFAWLLDAVFADPLFPGTLSCEITTDTIESCMALLVGGRIFSADELSGTRDLATRLEFTADTQVFTSFWTRLTNILEDDGPLFGGLLSYLSIILVSPPLTVLQLTSLRTKFISNITFEDPAGDTYVNASLLKNFPHLESLTIKGGLGGPQLCPFLGQLDRIEFHPPARELTFPEKCSCDGSRRTYVNLEGLGVEGKLPEWATLIECVDSFIGTSNVFSSAVELTNDRIEAIDKSDEVLVLALEDNAFTRALPRSYCNDNLVVRIEDRFDPCTSTSRGGLPWWAWTLIAVGWTGGLVGLGFGISAIVKTRKLNTRYLDKKRRVKYRIL